MSLKFGTSGLRGLSVDLKGEAAAIYSDAFARHLLKSGIANPDDFILMGRDFRESSPDIAAIAIGALRRAGLHPLDCGTVPTPALALYGMSLNAASLMVTGSHIPADRNGIKFYRPDGEIDKADEQAIAALAAETTGIDATPGLAEDRSAACAALFLERNLALLPDAALAGMRVGVYQHSTVARDLFMDVLAHYGADVVPLARSESFIPVDTEAVSPETLVLLKDAASEFSLDAIVSADGDGDRPLVADETGVPLRGDLLGLMAARFLKADVVATPVTSNSGLEAAGPYTVLRTRVGSPFVIAAMAEALAKGRDRVMGFEANGGLLTASAFRIRDMALAPLPTRDSFLPALTALYAAAQGRKTLSQLARDYRLPVAAADRLENFAVERSAALMAHLRSAPENLAAFVAPLGGIAAVSDVDGLRISLTNGKTVHFRPSGNAPEMRCYVEAENEEAAAQLLRQGLALALAFG